MRESVFRLIGISLASIVVAAIALLFLGALGSRQSFAPFEHDLLKSGQTYNFYKFDPLNPVEPTSPIDSVLNIPLVHITTDFETWILKDSPQKTRLADFLTNDCSFCQKGVAAFFVHSRINLGEVVRLLLEKNLQDSIVIFANEQKIHIELKKLAPRWLYAANPSQKMKLKIMDSIFLASMGDYDFDFYPLDLTKEFPLDQTLISELKRRYKKIILHSEIDPLSSNQIYDGKW
jgi:hypothetical protein